MKKGVFFIVLMLLTSLCASAQTENIEVGLQAGAAFYLGNENPMNGFTRMYEFAWVPETENLPAFESFGGFVRYRFDQRWALQLQAMRQRMRFTENHLSDRGLHFYNAMWNVDMMTEFNILKYGFVENIHAKVYRVTPYVAAGLGLSLYNKHATYRWGMKDGSGKQNSYFPAVKTNDLAAAMYMPFGVGVKLRTEMNWQIKVACQYDLFLVNGNVDGSSTKKPSNVDPDYYQPKDYNGVDFQASGYKYKPASTHNFVVTVAVIYNFPSNNKEGIIIDY